MGKETTLQTRQVNTGGFKTVVLQNENGPCPLVAIINSLVLRDSPLAAWLSDKPSIDTTEVISKLEELVDAQGGDERQNIDILFHFLPQLMDGLDVNPTFDGGFAPSEELEIFKMFGIPLVHGWVLGESEGQNLGYTTWEEASHESYESYCQLQFSETEEGTSHKHILATFVAEYPSQLTPSGYGKLLSFLKKQDGPAILFWNNHFSTVVHHGERIFSLVTDIGYEANSQVIWEEVNLVGAGDFANGDFAEPLPPPDTSGDALLAQQLDLENRNEAASRQDRIESTPGNKESPVSKAKTQPPGNSQPGPSKKKPKKAKSSGCVIA